MLYLSARGEVSNVQRANSKYFQFVDCKVSVVTTLPYGRKRAVNNMQTKETESDDGGFARLSVVKTVVFPLFLFLVARSTGSTCRGREMC